ncbi:hypothetical protein [Nostoc sp. JL33]|nr:hypothetical protein [Nostoc sp. JL33]
MLDERFYRNNYFCFLVVSDRLVTGQNPASATHGKDEEFDL